MANNKKIIAIVVLAIAILSFAGLTLVGIEQTRQFTKQANTASVAGQSTEDLLNNYETKNYFVSDKKDIANQERTNIIYPLQNNFWAYMGSAKPTDTYFAARFKDIAVIDTQKFETASIVLTTPVTQWINIDTSVYLEYSLDSQPITKTNLISKRIPTQSLTAYKNDSKWEANTSYKIDITASVKELLKLGNPKNITVIIKNNSTQSWSRKFFLTDLNSEKGPTLQLTFKKVLADPGQPGDGHEDHDHTGDGDTSTGGDNGPMNPIDSMSMGLWTPSKWDDCSKELHDSYSVIAPDGKKYPTWHPTVVVDPATGKECSFGHEHGLDPKLSPFWEEIKQTYYYDANKNGVMDAEEEKVTGLPFGYINEQMDVWQEGSANPLMRHEDHVGHKVTYYTDAKPWANNPNTPNRDELGVTCSFLQKIHQGTHSKDAFTNNLHEVVYMAKCSNGYSVNTAFMGKFGASGEFSTGLPCEPRGEITPLGKDATNNNYPGETGRGFREILTYDCAKEKMLVPDGQFSGHPYELWSLDGSPLFRRTDGSVIINGIPLGFAVFDPIRLFKAGAPNNLGYTMDLCYETESNGDQMRGSCYGTNYGEIKDITWDDPRSDYKGIHRDTYAGISNIYNAGKSTTYYCTPFGESCSTTAFKGSIKNVFSTNNIDWSKDYGNNYPIDPYGFGGDINYDPSGKVHAPN